MYNILLIIAMILTMVVFVVLLVSDGHLNDNQMATVILCTLFAMFAWAGFFYGVGDMHGANAVARGQYKTYYLYDKDGNVIDTIAKWNN